MIRIGVLSDTHWHGAREGGEALVRLAECHFADADLILHAGDLVDPEVLLALSGREVLMVQGNLDPPMSGVPRQRIITVGGLRIGLIHGWGAPQGLVQRVLGAFSGEHLDALVFGHSHYPHCDFRDGLLLFNPGSPTDPRGAPFPSVGLLEIGETLTGRIINLNTDCKDPS